MAPTSDICADRNLTAPDLLSEWRKSSYGSYRPNECRKSSYGPYRPNEWRKSSDGPEGA